MKLVSKEEVEDIVCDPVSVEEYEDIVKNTIPDMEKILDETGGIGLSASQVGIRKKFFVIRSPSEEGKFIYFFNAFYIKTAERTTSREGCLTYGKDKFAEVKRFKSVKVVHEEFDPETKSFIKVFTKAKGIVAFVLQHEIDHGGNGLNCKSKTIFM